MLRAVSLVLILFGTAALASEYAKPGNLGTAAWTYTWTDSSRRDRPIPVRIFLPQATTRPAPVVIFSHGLGGSRDGYEYIGRHLASHGYASVHLTHVGSDGESILRALGRGLTLQAAMRESAANLDNILNRPLDVSFAISYLTWLSANNAELEGKLDLSQIAVAGHSFGGYTAMAVAGQASLGRATMRDKRVACVIAMSAPVAKNEAAYTQIAIPVLMMTGTLDDSPALGGRAEGRIKSFSQLALSDHYLVVFNGGDHMVFAGAAEQLFPSKQLPGMDGDRSRDPLIREHILGLATAFLDAYLRQDAKAAQWLQSPQGAKADLQEIATWDFVKGR